MAPPLTPFFLYCFSSFPQARWKFCVCVRGVGGEGGGKGDGEREYVGYVTLEWGRSLGEGRVLLLLHDMIYSVNQGRREEEKKKGEMEDRK